MTNVHVGEPGTTRAGADGRDTILEDLRVTSGTTPGTTSLLRIVNIFLRHVRLFVWLPLALVLASALYVFTRPPTYSAYSLMRPEGSSGSVSQLAGLAAQFGMNVPGNGTSMSVDTYAELLTAPDYLRQVVQTDFPLRNGRRSNLLRYFLIDSTLPRERRLERGAAMLAASMAIGTNPSAGLVHLRTTAATPAMAEEINELLINTLERRTEALRRTRAEDERQFLDSQLREAQGSLSEAEDALQRFQQRNRVAQSPELLVEQSRLEREVQLNQSMYLSLAQGLQEARVNALRNGPVLSIMGSPLGTATRNSRSRLLVVVASLLFGLFAAAAMSLTLHWWERERTSHSPDYREFARLRQRLFALLLFGHSRAD